MPDPDRIARLPEAAAIAGLHPRTLHRLETEDRFRRRVRLGGRAVGWRMSDLDAWVAALVPASHDQGEARA